LPSRALGAFCRGSADHIAHLRRPLVRSVLISESNAVGHQKTNGMELVNGPFLIERRTLWKTCLQAWPQTRSCPSGHVLTGIDMSQPNRLMAWQKNYCRSTRERTTSRGRDARTMISISVLYCIGPFDYRHSECRNKYST